MPNLTFVSYGTKPTLRYANCARQLLLRFLKSKIKPNIGSDIIGLLGNKKLIVSIIIITEAVATFDLALPADE